MNEECEVGQRMVVEKEGEVYGLCVFVEHATLQQYALVRELYA